MHGLRTIVLLLTASMLASPLAQAQGSTTIQNPSASTPTTLYFHIFDTFNKFVINTQPMDADFFDVGGNNFPSVSSTPANEAYGANFDFNRIYGYSTAGPVEYEFIENGRPRFHPERGIAADVEIDPAVPAKVFLYLDVRDFGGGDTAPNYMPSFTFGVTVQEGDDPGIGANLDSGADIMLGETTFNLATFDANGNPYEFYCTQLINCAPDDPDAVPVVQNPPLPDEDFVVPGNQVVGEGQVGPDGNPILIPNEDGLVELVIELTDRPQDLIRKSTAFNVRIDWHQNVEEQFEEGQFAEGFFRFHTDPENLPRLEFAIFNPVYLSFIHPQVAANTLLIHAGGNSPWGTYDFDIQNVEMTIDGPVKPQNLRKVLTSNEHVHGLHDADAQLTYLWEFREENAPDGEYTIKMKVQNDAGSATATGEAKFIVEGDQATGIDTEGGVVPGSGTDDQPTPALGVVPGLLMLGAAMLLMRRRGGAA